MNCIYCHKPCTTYTYISFETCFKHNNIKIYYYHSAIDIRFEVNDNPYNFSICKYTNKIYIWNQNEKIITFDNLFYIIPENIPSKLKSWLALL